MQRAFWSVMMVGLPGFLLMGGCASDAASSVPVQALNAQVCTEGQGRDTRLLVRNLDDYGWERVEISVMKGEREYTVGIDPRSKVKHSASLGHWPPEEVTQSAPFDTASDFVFKGRSSDPKDPMYGQEQVPLTNFDNLDSAMIEIATPYPAERKGEVRPCE